MELRTRPVAKIDVLIVEDDESHVRLLRRAFRRSAASVELRYARDLRGMRSELNRKRPDFLILDYLLPDGRCVDALAEEALLDKLPVVVLTSFRDRQLDSEIKNMGVRALIQKSRSGFMRLPQLVLSEFPGLTNSPGIH